MILLSATNIKKSFGAAEVLKDVSVTLQEGDRIGLVGINGCGKTTLFNIIAGKLTLDEGNIQLARGMRLGFMEQSASIVDDVTVFEALLPVFQNVFDMEKKLSRLETEMAEETDHTVIEKLSTQYSALLERFEEENGYGWKSTITGTLMGLGFNRAQFDQPVNQLSGGERTRLFLAKILLEKPDILLLDEPTNHLDLSALSWLEDYLRKYKGAMLIVSHDRYFLDNVVNGVCEILLGESESYTGNYTEYQRRRTERFEQRMKAYELQQREIKRQEEIIARYRMYNKEWSVKKARSREKAVDRIERLKKPRDEKTARFSFRAKRRTGEDVLIARRMSKSFGERVLFSDVSMHIRSGERVILIGPNGAGKTTLIEGIVGKTELDDGTIQLGANVDIGYYDQLQSALHPDKTVLDEVWDRFRKKEQTEIRTTLSLFLFTGDEVFKQIRDLSGGEKGRVALTILMLHQDNFLVLDEPTNHLDTDAREVLEQTLDDFEGTILAVSHDRYFINRIADRVIELTDDGVMEYLGNYDDYLEHKNSSTPAAESDTELTKTEIERRRKREREESERQAEKTRRVRILENDIAFIEEEILATEIKLSDPDLFSNKEYAAKTAKRYKELQTKLEDAMAEWERAAYDV
jgi:ATP-binding cassette subfamily F protein 3